MYCKLNAWIQFATLYFTSLFIMSSSVFILTAILGLYQYHIGWFDNPFRDNIAMIGPFNIFLPLLFSIFVSFRYKWFFRVMIILLLCSIDFYLKKSGILHFSSNWAFLHLILFYLLMIFILEHLNYILSKNKRVLTD